MRQSLFLMLLLVVAACKKGGYDQRQMALLTAPEQKIVGRYKMETEWNVEGSTEFKDLMAILEAMEGGETTMECFPDRKFVMNVGEVPVTGDWNLEATIVSLRILKVGEMKPEQVARIESKNQGISGFNMGAKQREEFLSAFKNSLALERAEQMTSMRVGTDANLYAVKRDDGLFGAMVSYFKRLPKD